MKHRARFDTYEDARAFVYWITARGYTAGMIDEESDEGMGYPAFYSVVYELK